MEGFQEVEGRLRVNFKQSVVSSEKGVVPISVVRLQKRPWREAWKLTVLPFLG